MRLFLSVLLSLFVAFTAGAGAETRVEAVSGQSEFVLEYGKATDFSGLAWVKGRTFYAVSNATAALFPLNLDVDLATGKITAGKFGAMLRVKSKLSDFEGIAYWPARDRLYVSTERPPGIVGFDMLGDATFYMEVPKVFARARRNKGLESLTYGARHFWTANEDALEGDGEESSPSSGALVRLQKMDERFRPVGQFAYRTDTSFVRMSKTGTGVTDLVALPNGQLLVLERVVGLGLLARIYLVDFEGATDISAIARLAGAKVEPVKKKLLFERATGRENYEGMALGPELAEGWRSLILMADNGGGSRHSLMPLRIRVESAE